MSAQAICMANFIAILVLLTIAIISYAQKNLVYGRVGLIVMSSSLILFLVCDIIYRQNLGFTDEGSIMALFLSKTAYFILNTIIAFAWCGLLGTAAYQKALRTKKVFTVVNILLVLNIAVLLVNLFVPLVFRINAEGQMDVIMPGMIGITLVNYAMFVIGFTIIINNRSKMRMDMAEATLIFPIPAIVAELVMLIDHNVDVIAMYSISALIVFYIVQLTQSFIDTLTGLGNRSRMGVVLARWFSSKTPHTICCVLIDIDGMHAINESLGHNVGDRMIERTALIIRKAEEDLSFKSLVAIRYGGDEFMLMWHSKDESGIETVKNAIQHYQIEVNKDIPKAEHIHFTMGSYFASNLGSVTPDDFLRTADSQLRHRQTEIDIVIEKAIRDRSLEVYFQPLWSTEHNEFRAMEVLCRLKHENYGFISPDIFITAAEKSGAILEMGDIILDKACEFIASPEFKALGIRYAEINLSVAQTMDRNLLPRILKIIDGYGIPHSQIDFEITETATSISNEILWENVKALAKEGFGLSLDDFGSGYSNVNRLFEMPPSVVKLDKAIVDKYDDPKGRIVLEMLIDLLHTIGTRIVCEGVETADQVEKLSALHCEYLQGFYFSKAVPKEELVEFIEEHKASEN